MTYKDLNVYQRAYKVAIDLHQFLEKDGGKFTTGEIDQLKSMSRDIIGNIAEGFAQRTPKAKRFFNFKALDVIHRIMMDLDFLRDTQRLSDEKYNSFYEEYEICTKMLYKFNQSILEKANQQISESADQPKEKAGVAA
jgi:four helix bundle protein